MFDWFPILKGKYFTAEQYLQLIVLIITAIIYIISLIWKKNSLKIIAFNIIFLSFAWFGNNKELSFVFLVSYNFKSKIRLLFILCLYFFTFDICFAMHNQDQGFFFIFDGVSFSSAFTRMFSQQQKEHCYVTLSENQDQIIFNFQTQTLSDYKLYCNNHQFNFTSFPLYDRYIYHSIIDVEQNNLIEIKKNNVIIHQFNYYGFKNDSFVLIDGGDSGYTERSIKIWNQISKLKHIDAINIGGDVAYDNGIISCISCWDKFFSLYEMVCKNQNKLIPLIVSVGNHDVGRVINSDLLFNNQLSALTPYIIQMFPQHLNNNNQIPQIDDRKSFFKHILGPFNLITLDSGYLSNVQDQNIFFQNAINTDKINLVSYHIPIIPLEKENQEFVETFYTQLNLVNLVFEHHKHNLKQSKQVQIVLRNDKFQYQQGNTYYIGNGAMGIQSGKKVLHNMIAYSGTQAHVWLVEFENNITSVNAIDQDGRIVNRFQF